MPDVPSDLDPVVADALGSRPEPHALAPAASAQAAEQAGNRESGPNVQAECASEGGEPVTLDVSQRPGLNPQPTGRTVTGLFAPGNGIGVATRFQGSAPQHGVKAFALTGKLPDDVRDWRDDVKRGLVLDNGGPDALTAAQRVLVEAVADVATHRKLYARFIEREGLLTSRGRRRAAEDGHNAATDRLVRLLGLLGTGRRARPVDTLDSIARAIAASRTERPAETTTLPDDADVGPARERVPTARAAVTPEAS